MRGELDTPEPCSRWGLGVKCLICATMPRGKQLFQTFAILFSFIFFNPALAAGSGMKFRVFHNTLDPAVFGTAGGAHLVNATAAAGIGSQVEALTICVRFQVNVSDSSQ